MTDGEECRMRISGTLSYNFAMHHQSVKDRLPTLRHFEG